MDDARYIILPGDLRKDDRLTLAHWKVALVLGAYSKRYGWTDLTQNDVGEMAGISRQTACEAVGDLVEWGWVARKKKDKKNQYVYRFIMDRDEDCQPQPTVPKQCRPQPTEHCQPQPTGTVGSVPTFTKEECSSLEDQVTAPLPPLAPVAPPSGQIGFNGMKGSGVGVCRPSIRIKAGDIGWSAWMGEIEKRAGAEAREAFEIIGEIRVEKRWPSEFTPLPGTPR